jgi:hypothetical protein
MAGSGIIVSYGSSVLQPTPIVNYSRNPINLGGYIYGYNTDVSLDGWSTGIVSTGVTISSLTGIFANQFQPLVVTDSTGAVLYNWPNITVNSITFDQNTYFSGSMVKYRIALTSFDVPSGVMDISNSYGFDQAENGEVSVSHKISARGVRNNNGAFQNAINFVQQFTGQDPYMANCAPYFISSGKTVLMSIAENINRADSLYSITENYKFTTGNPNPYLKTTSLDINDSIEADFKTIDYTVKFQGSPVTKNAQSIINSYLQYGLLTDISNEFGLNTSSWVKNSYGVTIDSGSAIIEIKAGFSSGAQASGYLDYTVSLQNDLVKNLEDWKIEGDFRCFGPLDYKLNQISLFKQAHGSNSFRDYLTGLIMQSPIYNLSHDTNKLFGPNNKVSVDENPQLATLKLGLGLDAGYEENGLADMKYTISASPSRWQYELLPSATIEGDFIIQDLNMATAPKQTFTISCNTYNKPSGLSSLSGYLDNLIATYVITGTQTNVQAFLIEEQYSTGTYNVSYSKTFLGQDSGISSSLLSLQAIGTSTALVPLRSSGYNWGY